jgi:hypothetical protein
VTASSPFPPFQHPCLTREEVILLLREWTERKWCKIFRGDEQAELIIETDGGKKIYLRPSVGGYIVRRIPLGVWKDSAVAMSASALEEAVAQAFADYGEQWRSQAKTVRLGAGEPFSNVKKIADLIAGHEIQAVFDPYLDASGLTCLLDIFSCGAAQSYSLRLLSSTRMTQGKVPRLTKSLMAQWFAQRGITAGEVRLMPPSEHRRFMLLSGGQSLILGMSLNSIAKNEAVRLEPDTEDRPFFESVWASATPL